MFDVQGQTVRKWLNADDIPVRQAQQQTMFKASQLAHNKIDKPSKDVLERLYHQDALTSAQIALMFSVSDTTVQKWLRSYDLPLRPAGNGLAARGISMPSAEQLYDLIHVQNKSYREIAEMFGVDQSAVPYWLDDYGIERSKSWHEIHNNPQSVNAMRSLYDAGLSLNEIAARYGVSATPLVRLFKEHDIQLRKDGWQGGKRFLTKSETPVRSTYELKVADWLFDHGVSYIYEPPLPFSAVWRADFLANGWFIEIWGVLNSKTYKDRKQQKIAQYAACKVPLIEISAHHFNKANNGLWERRLAHCLSTPPT